MSGFKTGFLFVIICAALTAASCNAQEEPIKGELYGGYQYTRIGGSEGMNANGWNAAFTGNVNHWFGVTGDFSGAYKSIGGVSAKAYTCTFGPTFSLRQTRTKPFAHVLVGGFHASAGFQGLSDSINGFALLAGGGVDVKATEHGAIRVIQGAWIMWHAKGTSDKSNGRISVGVVFRF